MPVEPRLRKRSEIPTGMVADTADRVESCPDDTVGERSGAGAGKELSMGSVSKNGSARDCVVLFAAGGTKLSTLASSSACLRA